jgi:transcriptional regulator with XRE-family HTH domain
VNSTQPDQDDLSDDTIGGRISLARDASGLSLEEAADFINVSPEAWANWENDRCAPISSRVTFMSRLLGVSPAWIVSGRGDGPRWT